MIDPKKRLSGFALPYWSQTETELNRKTRLFFAEHVNFETLTRQKSKSADLKQSYRRRLEQSMVGSLFLILILFQLTRFVEMQPAVFTRAEINIEVTDIPPTEQPSNLPPPPGRPTIPVPTENELVPEDLTIESTDLNLELSELTPPPAPEENIEDTYVFIPYDEPPVPIGGLKTINRYLKYPEIARRAGIEAVVIVGVLVGENGNSLKTQILKPSGTTLGFEQAAQDAVMKLKWKPAKQRDRAIKVWVSFPIRFQLGEAQRASG